MNPLLLVAGLFLLSSSSSKQYAAYIKSSGLPLSNVVAGMPPELVAAIGLAGATGGGSLALASPDARRAASAGIQSARRTFGL